MKVLYITYTGLTENLGQSQILPYIVGLAKRGVSYTVISFEPAPFAEERRQQVLKLAAGLPIEFVFLKRPSKEGRARKVLIVFWEMWLALRHATSGQYDLIHCRNAFAAEIAVLVARNTGKHFIFDMRGFWGDARKDSGAWDTSRLVWRLVYRIWKWRERTYLGRSALANVLTEKARAWVVSNGLKASSDIFVTPCCVDFSKSDSTVGMSRSDLRQRLGFQPDDFICVYAGSAGGVYDDKRLLNVFAAIKKNRRNAKLLVLGSRSADEWLELATRFGVKIASFDIVGGPVPHEKVFEYFFLSDVGLSFMRSSFYTSGVSSTKIGEYLSVGLPFIANAGIGDVAALSDKTGGSLVLSDECIDDDANQILDFLNRLPHVDRGELRRKAREILDIEVAFQSYEQAYGRLGKRGDRNGG